jgi:hypothetical protein
LPLRNGAYQWWSPINRPATGAFRLVPKTKTNNATHAGGIRPGAGHAAQAGGWFRLQVDRQNERRPGRAKPIKRAIGIVVVAALTAIAEGRHRPQSRWLCDQSDWLPQRRQLIVFAIRPAKLDRYTLAFDIAGFHLDSRKAATMGAYPSGEALWREPDHRQLPRLLRARREWPRGRAAEKRDEAAALHACDHSITSSAAVRGRGL